MTFAALTFANPAALWLGLLALPIIALHVLKPKRDDVPVSSTFLWRAHADPVSSARPWQRLRFSLLLLLQVLAVAGLTLAIAKPVTTKDTPLAEHTVFIVDTSASMGALDGAPDRLADARAESRRLREQLPAGGRASLITAGARARVVLNSSPDRGEFDEAIDSLALSFGRADFAGAFTLAESLETSRSTTGFVLVSDGGLTADEQRLIPAGTRYVRIGGRSINRGIADLRVEPRGSGLYVYATVANTGGPDARQSLRIDVDGAQAAIATLDLKSNSSVTFEADLPPGDRIEAFLEGEDLLDLDDRAYAVASRRRDIRVLQVGPENLFLDAMLSTLPGVTVERVGSAADTAGYDVVIYDGVAVPAKPTTPFIAIAPPGGLPGIEVTGTAAEPAITLAQTADPLLEGIDFSDVAIAQSQALNVSGSAQTLIASDTTPLLLSGRLENRPFVYLAFSIADSNLPVQLAFPLLGDRAVTSLSGASLAPDARRVGDPLVSDTTKALTVQTPGGSRRAVSVGGSVPIADRPGFYTITDDTGTSRVVAVNADPFESTVSPAQSLAIAVATGDAASTRGRSEASRLLWVLVPLIGIVVAEYLLARRRVGVRRRQWRFATAMRIGILALLLLALFDFGFDRRSDNVATVFVIDSSDSMQRVGRQSAYSFVADALDNQPRGARSALAVFGSEARVDRALGRNLDFDVPTVTIDASRTNLANALRLAGAVLPANARRRVVLLTDGRSTHGDATEEAHELVERGIALDVVVIEPKGGIDVAVASVNSPGHARPGEIVPIEAIVTSNTAVSAVATLRANGVDVETRPVELKVGSNALRFQRPVTEAGLVRYQVAINAPGDATPQNNGAFEATLVEGPARVLVLEGAAGNGASFAAALRAGGLAVDIGQASSIPPLDTLSTYSSIVLVDVNARNLTGEQVAALSGAVRDTGRGLVAIGGTQSYGLGAYYKSELEKLLPVVSEVLDPKRRQDVAEVLAIDTSGSMSACHCKESANGLFSGGNRVSGGVNKTDISRSAAAQAIGALAKTDEIGVLAFNKDAKWVIDLQKVPAEDVVRRGLDSLQPSGSTDISNTLTLAAERLRRSQAGLRHIILFTDGFAQTSALRDLADQAAELAAEGITVSVVGTGEGSARELEDIARAGRGRFYPGRSLEQIPSIITDETIIAARDFVNEGSFFPEISSSSNVVRALTSAPPVLGYVATTAKPTATTHLRVGAERDPLLATWQAGLGKASAWTSDATDRWSQQWASWPGFVEFWTTVVKDTFPSANADGAVGARIADGVMRIEVEAETPFADGATAVARVTAPDGSSREVALQRASGTRFTAEVEANEAGTYAVGASVSIGEVTAISGSTLASLSYSNEYRPGAPDREGLLALSQITGGRGEITPAQAFDREGTTAGSSRINLAGRLLLAAALAWPLAVALSRINLRPAPSAPMPAGTRAARTERVGAGTRAASSNGEQARPSPPGKPPPARTGPAPPEHIGRLLDRKRRGNSS